MRALYVSLRDWFLYDVRLNRKIIFIYIICTSIPLMLLTWFTSSAVSEQVGKQSENYMCSIIEQSCSFINYRLSRVIDKVDSIYLDSELYDYLSDTSDKNNSKSIKLLEAKLSSMTDTGEISAVNLYLNEMPSVPGSSHCHPISSIQHTVWYPKITGIQLKTGVWVYSSESKCFYYIKKMYSKYDSSELIGYVTAAIPQNIIEESLSMICYASQSIAYLVDNNGYPIISVSQDKNTDPLTDSIINIDLNNQYNKIKINNSVYFTVSKSLTQNSISNMPQWNILMLTPWKVIFGKSETLLKTVLIASFASVFVLILFASWLIKGITNRIDKLNDSMKNIRVGASASCMIPMGCDEISSLQSNFNNMIVRMNNMFNQTIDAEERARKSDMFMLQSQINPHFLYNTLDIIKWEAKEVGCSEIEEHILLLSKYYRMSLQKGMSMVPLEDELTHIRLYIDLQNKRFRGKIELIDAIPVEHKKCTCIKLLLQPIVENSITHGIIEKKEPNGIITLQSTIDGDDILIIIKDNGCGMPPEKVELLNAMGSICPNKGFGIYNTRQRIVHCFGEKYGINFTLNEFKGITATIRLPFSEYRDNVNCN